MERKMRRFKQLLSEEDAKGILGKATNGVISLIDSNGEPYGVPISFVYDGKKSIYFHSAVKGYKIDCIESNGRCSFCVVSQDIIVPEEFTTYYRSVIVRGSVREVVNVEEKRKGLLLLCEKYSAGINPEAEISKCFNHVMVLCLDIDSMTGKEAIELVRNRKMLNYESV